MTFRVCVVLVFAGKDYQGTEVPLADIARDTLTLQKGTELKPVDRAVLRLKRGETKSTRKHSDAVKTLLQSQDIVT